MYQAIANGTIDELYNKYCAWAACPVGTAGESCELPCDPVHGQADVRGNCVCKSTKWTGSDCSMEVLENVNLIPLSLKATCYAMVAVNFVVVAICFFWLFVNRDTPQVKVSQPIFLSLVLLGCLISTSTILALVQEDDAYGDVPACMAIPWLYRYVSLQYKCFLFGSS